MNYKDELAKMKKHRALYFPAMSMLLDMHNDSHQNDPPVPIKDTSGISIILEMMDIGYVEKDSFIIKRDFGDIAGLYYKGGLPLTGEGMKAFSRDLADKQKKIYGIFFICILLILVLLAVLYFF